MTTRRKKWLCREHKIPQEILMPTAIDYNRLENIAVPAVTKITESEKDNGVPGEKGNP